MSKSLETTPKQDGFRMPGEFEKHAGCWMVWPQRPDIWRLGAKPIQEIFVQLTREIRRFEPLTVCVNADQYETARNRLDKNIRVVEVSNDDIWARDFGATFVSNGSEIRGIDWSFNAWGGLYDGLYFPWVKDDAVAQKICEIERVDRYKLKDFVLEGGSIHVDGEGTLLVTEECLLSKGRNPQLTKEEIENVLKEYLNLEKIIWLKRGIYNDETNGHVDNICCFVKPGEVLLAWTDDESDPQYEISKENYDILSNATDAKGRKLKVTKLYLPNPVLLTEEECEGIDTMEDTIPRVAEDRMAASYVNFYIANGGILFPLFDDPNDEKARQTLQESFPNHEIVGIPAREILLGGGNIHCITQQQPLNK